MGWSAWDLRGVLVETPMSDKRDHVVRAASNYIAALNAHERSPLGTPESARCAAEVGRCLESLRAAVEDVSVPTDQARDVERFIAEGGGRGV